MAEPGGFPRYRPVGADGLLAEFGETIAEAIHERVLDLDAALAAAPFAGFREAVPAYASLLVCFDPIVTDHATVRSALDQRLARPGRAARVATPREVAVCYDDPFAPDLDAVAEAAGLTREAAIGAHLGGAYKVYMYGFAPGYAYLAGVPAALQRPRKQTAVRGVPAGSVVIAGPQCLVTTLAMPTGWWIIGRSPTSILSDDPARPFLFDVGDPVTFRRVDRAALGTEAGSA